MTTYKTGNPVGSAAVKDLYDNAENLDQATNNRTSREWTDRLGKQRRTMWGMEQDFQDLLINSRYESIGDYAAGLQITTRNQIFWKDGELYRAGAVLELPYTTTGDWAVEAGLFVAVGDQALRQQLADTSDPSNSAAMVGFKQAGVGTVARNVNSKFQEHVSAKDFGAVGDGVADDTAAMLAFGLHPASRKTIPSGRYKITQMISFNPGDILEGDGAKSIIDASGAASWPYPAVVKVAGVLTQIANLGANATLGDDSITLASTSGVAAGDSLIIYNPTIKSWSGWRDEYKAGEFVRVHSVIGTEVLLMSSLYDSYNAVAVSVYRLDGAATTFREFTVLAPSREIVGVQMSLIDRPTINNVWSTGALGSSLQFERCADLQFNGSAFQTQAPTNDEYGVSIANCHGGMVVAPSLNAGRHGLAIGGYGYVGSVTNRAITVMVGSMGNRAPTASQDLHGNAENFTFIGGTFQNGSTIGGQNHKFIGCRMIGKRNNGIALYVGEPRGGNFEFTSCTFEALVNPSASGYGILELGNLSANTRSACKFIFNNCTIKAPNTVTYAVKVYVDGTAHSPTIIFDGVDLECAGLTQFIRMARDSGVGTIDRIAVTNLYGLASGAEFVVNAGTGLSVTRYRLPPQQGLATIAGNTSLNNAVGSVSYRNPYPVAPLVNTFKPGGATIGGAVFIPSAGSVNGSGFQISANTANGSNYPNTNDGLVGWIATLDQG